MAFVRRIPPPLAAASTFLLCLLLGLAARPITSWLLRPETLGALTVSVRSGRDSVRVGNLTASPWRNCVVSLDGGWDSRPFAIEPGAVARVTYDEFVAGTSPGRTRPSFTQAFRQAAVHCDDVLGRRQDAVVE